jgi:hypothetical protein
MMNICKKRIRFFLQISTNIDMIQEIEMMVKMQIKIIPPTKRVLILTLKIIHNSIQIQITDLLNLKKVFSKEMDQDQI